MPRTFVLHDESINTSGFRMLTAGADLTEFRKNPVMLYNHNDWSRPIGRWENIRIEGVKILADAVFDLEDKRENGGAEIASQVERDFIRMASIGAWPPDEIDDNPYNWAQGQFRPTVTKWRVREASVCPIGQNHNALTFYDQQGNVLDLTDQTKLVSLMDTTSNRIFNKDRNMNELNQILKLSDTATLAEQATAVRNLVSDNERLKTENVTFSDQIDNLNKAAKEKKSAEAIALVDAAVKDGRLPAANKDNFIRLFDLDFDNAKATLENLPKRKSVVDMLNNDDKDAIELADLQKQSWQELDKAGKLTMLRDKHYDVYAAKYKERFGVELKKA